MMGNGMQPGMMAMPMATDRINDPLQSGLQPVMQPGMQPVMQLGMRPVIQPSMQPVMMPQSVLIQQQPAIPNPVLQIPLPQQPNNAIPNQEPDDKTNE